MDNQYILIKEKAQELGMLLGIDATMVLSCLLDGVQDVRRINMTNYSYEQLCNVEDLIEKTIL
jgi:hypothetical protein